MKNLKAYIMENSRWLAVILCIALVMTVTMLLNGIPSREIAYGMLLCLFVTAVALFAGYGMHCESFRQLEQMQKNIIVSADEMKEPEYMYESQYQDCIRRIAQEKDRIQNEMMSRQQDLSEYYSMWVHQIKTPIAALKLLLDEEMNACLDADDIQENDMSVTNVRQKQNELFRIEQYVDMALQYTRLGAQTNDFVIESVLLDEVIKPSVHKYARQFISKQLRLTYVPQDISAVTDKKWLGFVIDQLLSNAIKYTKQGGVMIQVVYSTPSDENNPDMGIAKAQEHWYHRAGAEQDGSIHIIIEDTGIGISAEDLPRVCEKGYTGYNGHADQYSTGIGLYLCRAILDRLGHQFVIRSEKGRGTKAEIILNSNRN